MDCSDAIDRLIEHLLTREPTEPAIPDEIVEHIAGCRSCIAELDAISTALTGEPSTLKAEADKLLTLRQPFDTAQDKAQDAACQECQAALPAYVEEQVAGEDVAKRYPRIEGHLQSCAGCREQHGLLHEMLQQEAAGTFGESPSYVTFEEWFQPPHGDPAPLPEPVAPTTAPFWEQLSQNLRRLVADIPILIGQTSAAFGQLPSPLAPRLVPVGVYREREPIPTTEEGEELVELLELPHTEANLVIKIRMGPVFDGKGTLVLDVGTITPPQPIAQAKVTLRDEDGGLLEGMPTDEDGLAFFRELDIGKYIIQVEHAGQAWEFCVRLDKW